MNLFADSDCVNAEWTDEEIDAADRHTTEAQVREMLKEEADICLDGARDVPELIRRFLLSSRRSDHKKRCSPEFQAHVGGAQLLSSVDYSSERSPLGRGSFYARWLSG